MYLWSESHKTKQKMLKFGKTILASWVLRPVNLFSKEKTTKDADVHTSITLANHTPEKTLDLLAV
jgi:hypothetical protein